MQKPQSLNYAEHYKDRVVSCGPFALRSTGIIQGQTSLKVDSYSLACVPYQFTMSRAVLLGAFSKDELAFFQRFKNSLAALSLTVHPANAREPTKIFCRCQISAIGTMKGRDRLGLIVGEFKPIPPSLETILGEHLLEVERLRIEWKDLQGRSVQVNPESSKTMGFNNYAVMTMGTEQFKLALFSLAVDGVEFLMPLRTPDMAVGSAVSLHLFFQKYRFTVAGTISSALRLPTGVQRVRASLEFSPELGEILSDYHFQTRVRAKNAEPGA